MHYALTPTTSIIVSVYKDGVALELILNALQQQSRKDFEIIISEDGCNDTMQEIADKWSADHDNIHHLSQKDEGFRKNRALNRAIAYSNADHLVFIDGDCIPHPSFIEAHQIYMGNGCASAGRRAELGQDVSNDIRIGRLPLEQLFNPFQYLFMLPRLIVDNIKHPGHGIPLRFLQRFVTNRYIRILGCNFSCHKHDIYRINGFNEDFTAAGWGEDSDIEWRLRHIGVKIYNIKFSAIQYHLHHERWYELDDKYQKIFENSMRDKIYYCERGLSQHSADIDRIPRD